MAQNVSGDSDALVTASDYQLERFWKRCPSEKSICERLAPCWFKESSTLTRVPCVGSGIFINEFPDLMILETQNVVCTIHDQPCFPSQGFGHGVPV